MLNKNDRGINKKNIEKILKYIELNEKEEDNKGRLNEDRDVSPEKRNG